MSGEHLKIVLESPACTALLSEAALQLATWVDLVTTEHDPAGKFTCSCHSGPELVIDGGPKGGDTCSRVSGGTVSMDHSGKHSSVEPFSGDIINHATTTGSCAFYGD